eukprot:15343627-Ditylum_brightwellii.AAC.1
MRLPWGKLKYDPARLSLASAHVMHCRNLSLVQTVWILAALGDTEPALGQCDTRGARSAPAHMRGAAVS